MKNCWKKTVAAVAVLAFAAVAAAAQEGGEDPETPPISSDWDDYSPALYARGDQNLMPSAGVTLPVIFLGDDIAEGEKDPFTWFMKVGGVISLSYNYFLGSHFFLGGEAGVMFAGTRGENTYFAYPFGLQAGWQFVAGRFEFPLTLMIGAAPQSYRMGSVENYFGMIVKPGAAAFFRYNASWSFGLNAKWWLLPQWPSGEGGQNAPALGNFLEVTLALRYHF